MLSNWIIPILTFYTSYTDSLGGVANFFQSGLGNEFIQSFLGGFGGAFLTSLVSKGTSGDGDIEWSKMKIWLMTGLYAGALCILTLTVLNTINMTNNQELISALAAAMGANYAYYGKWFPSMN